MAWAMHPAGRETRLFIQGSAPQTLALASSPVSLTVLVVLTAVVVAAAAVAGAVLAFRREDLAREALAESVAAGLDVPASLHPVIDTDVCLCSGACIDACAEKVLGSVDGA